jgi:Tfp pilus assembly protein PilF
MNTPTRKERLALMLADAPDDPELRYMLAMEYVMAEDDAGAVGVFEELLRRAPNYPPAYHQAARALQRLDRVAEARSMLQRGIPTAFAQNDAHTAGEMQQLLDYLTTG